MVSFDTKILTYISLGISIIALFFNIYNYVLITELKKSGSILYSLKSINLPGISEYNVVYGNSNDIIIFEYSELFCPYCARFFVLTFPEIKRKYIDTGIISYVSKNFIVHREPAGLLSRYAICIYKEKGFNEYYDFKSNIFKELYDVAFVSGNYTKLELVINETLNKYKDLESCINNPDIINLINKETEEAINIYEFSGTPSFLIAIKMDRITEEKLKRIKDDLDSLKPYGFSYNMWVSADKKYFVLGFSGALPIEFFDSILSQL